MEIHFHVVQLYSASMDNTIIKILSVSADYICDLR